MALPTRAPVRVAVKIEEASEIDLSAVPHYEATPTPIKTEEIVKIEIDENPRFPTSAKSQPSEAVTYALSSVRPKRSYPVFKSTIVKAAEAKQVWSKQATSFRVRIPPMFCVHLHTPLTMLTNPREVANGAASGTNAGTTTIRTRHTAKAHIAPRAAPRWEASGPANAESSWSGNVTSAETQGTTG